MPELDCEPHPEPPAARCLGPAPGMTFERCPACRSRLALAPVCPRCGCDLTFVRRAEDQVGLLLARALQAWATGDRCQARALVRACLRLKNDPLAAAVRQALGPA